MPASEETPDRDKRDILEPIVSPITLEDYMPGSPVGDFMPGTPNLIPEIISDVSELEQTADDADTLIENDLVNSYNEFSSTLREVTAIILGDIENSLQSVEAILAKVRSKILDDIAGGLDHVYGINASLGFQPPTMEAVKYGLATGDYIGAMDNPPIAEPLQDTPMVPGEIPLVGGDGNTGLQPWFENDTIDPVPAWNQGLCYCPVFTPLGIVFSWADWSCVNEPGAMGPTSCNLLDWTTFQNEPREGRWLKWLILYAFSEAANCGYKYVVTPAIFSNGAPPVLLRNPETGEMRATYNQPGYWEVYSCAYRLEEIVVDLDGGGPSQPPMPPQPPQPPQPPSEPPTNPGVCATNKFNCGDPGKPIETFAPKRADTFCEQLEMWLSDKKVQQKQKFNEFFRVQWEQPEANSPIMKALKGITGGSIPAIPDLINRFGEWLQKQYDQWSQTLGCDNASLAPAQFVLSFLNLFNKYLPVVPAATFEAQAQIVNTMCQYKIPNGSEINAMYLADVITEETWRCLHKANGNYTSEQKKMYEGMRTRPDPFNLSKMFRQKLIKEDEFKRRMRESGVIYDSDRDLLHNMTKAWPSISDVTRFLVRDVADNEIVRRFGLDEDFEQKWQGKLVEFADAIGVEKDLGKYYWRAHWHIPSFTQLKEMAARLRPGRVDEDIATTYEDMYDALKMDDWLPFWARRMMAIGQPAIPKSEVVKAYNLRVIDEKELYERFLDLGYNDKDAQMYVDYHKAWRERDEKKKAGWPTIPALVKDYSKCLLTLDQFQETLTKLAMSDEQIAQAIEAASLSYDTEIRRTTIQGIMYQYRRGLISEEEANASLSAAGIPPGCVPALVKRWTSQKMRTPKQLPAGQLCTMRKYGVITAEEQVNALVRVGYDSSAAVRMTELCTRKLTEDEVRRANKQAEKAAREFRRQQKEDAKRRKEEQCGLPPCPQNTPGGQQEPPVVPT